MTNVSLNKTPAMLVLTDRSFSVATPTSIPFSVRWGDISFFAYWTFRTVSAEGIAYWEVGRRDPLLLSSAPVREERVLVATDGFGIDFIEGRQSASPPQSLRCLVKAFAHAAPVVAYSRDDRVGTVLMDRNLH